MELSSIPKTATLAELKALRLELLQSPLKTADGKAFQFGRDDKETMEGALDGLLAFGGTEEWRLLQDGDSVTVDHAALAAYYQELKLLRAKRGREVDAHYMALKTKVPLLQRDLVDWKKQVAAAWWE